MTTTGHVTLIGAGPGDPDLLTVKAVRCLRQADVVVYDRLAAPVVRAWAPDRAELVYAGKRKNLHTLTQAQINERLVELARNGHQLARVKGGDPFIFGRGGEEMEALIEAGLSWSVIPGITAATGAAAQIGLPLTHRDYAQGVTFVTAHRAHGRLDLDWDLVLRPRQTVVFYMGFSVLDQLAAELINRGQSPTTPFSCIASACLPQQQVVHADLATIVDASRNLPRSGPVLLVMHGYRKVLNDAGQQLHQYASHLSAYPSA